MRKPFMPEILARIAPRIGARVTLEPEYQFVGMVEFKNGGRSFFWDNKFNLNPVSSVKLVQDKAYTTHFLRQFGYPVPKERTFMRPSFRTYLNSSRGLDEAVAFASEIGWPVYLKPCRLSQGDLVTKVENPAELKDAAQNLFQRARVMIVQEALVGHDLRLVVLDDEVISAYERVPLTVVGDGFTTVRGLLEQLQQRFVDEGRDTIIPLEDSRIHDCLRRQRMDSTTILEANQRVVLLDVANLSLGGTTVDLVDQLHPDLAALAVRVAQDFDLRFCGIDLITKSLDGNAGGPVLLEINSAPGLDNYALTGQAQIDYADELYVKVLRAVERGARPNH